MTLQDPKAGESTPLIAIGGDAASEDESGNLDGTEHFEEFKADNIRRESLAADRLSMRLLQVADDDSETEERILKESLDVSLHGPETTSIPPMQDIIANMQEATRNAARERLFTMVGLLLLVFGLIGAALWVGVEFIGPPNQPVGPYELVERQVRTLALSRTSIVGCILSCGFHPCVDMILKPTITIA